MRGIKTGIRIDKGFVSSESVLSLLLGIYIISLYHKHSAPSLAKEVTIENSVSVGNRISRTHSY